MAFKVISIIDGDTVRVLPGWVFQDRKGDIVKVRGYKTPSEINQGFAIKKLKDLLLNKEVELKSASFYRQDSEALLSSVFLNGVDIKVYFPEYS